MKITRLSLTLPAHLAGTAHHDARQIAEAMAREIARGATPPAQITAQGRTGAQIAQSITAQMPRSPSKGGSQNGR
ncbi:hypothetical protein ACS3SW_20310 [Roseobacteraceae bacterium S113]